MEQSGLDTVAIIIPALNEAATIASVVARVGQHGAPIVVDDGSIDETPALAAQAGAQLVRHARNSGYDAALASGFARAAELGYRYAITIDADGQHDPTQLPKFISLLLQGNDVVLGIRDRQQRLAETIFAWVGKRLWRIDDPLCGMKGYRMTLYLALGHFDSFRSIGTELAVRAAASGARVAQLPVTTRDRLDAPRFARRLSANLKILRALALLLWMQALGRLGIPSLSADT